MQAVNVIYQLIEKPDKICARLIKNLVRALLMDQNGEKRVPSPVDDSTSAGTSQLFLGAKSILACFNKARTKKFLILYKVI